MTNLKLEIAGLSLDINGDIGVAITYQLQDIKDVGSRSQGFTYTIKIPASQSVNEIFYSLYDLGVSPDNDNLFRNAPAFLSQSEAQPFNRNRYTPARLIQNGSCIFDGWLILDRIVTERGKIHSYEIVLIGDRAKWVEAAKNLQLRDISFYDICTCFNRAFIEEALAVTSGADINNIFCLPFIDYGNLAGNLAPGVQDIDIEDLYPAFFVKALVYHGFNQLGYEVIENVFENGLENLILPYVTAQWLTTLGAPGGLIAAADKVGQIPDMPRDFNTDHAFSTVYNPCVIDFDTVISDQFNTLHTFVGNNIVEGPTIGPPGTLHTNMFSPPNAVACAGGDILIRYVFSVTFRVDIRTLSTVVDNGEITFELRTGGAAFPFYTDGLDIGGPSGIREKTFSFDGVIALTPGNTVFPRIAMFTEFNTGWRNFEIFNCYQEIYLDATSRENYVFCLKEAIPQMNFLDLMRGLITMFNLIVQTDENEKVVTINHRDYFYQTPEEALYSPPGTGTERIQYYDWGARVDYNQTIEQTFANRELPRYVNFKYEDGSDYLIEQYNNTNEQPYASYQIENDCQVVTDDSEVTASPFAATLTGEMLHDLSWWIVARLTDKDTVPAENVTDWEPRILLFDPLPPKPFGAFWNLRYDNFTSGFISTTFRHAYMKGRLGNLEFSSLYANYYQREYDLLFATRIVKLSVYLNETDLVNLDFSKPVRIGAHWFYISKIDKYKPNDKATKVELIQIV